MANTFIALKLPLFLQHHQWTLKIIHNTFSEMQMILYKAPQMVLQAETTNVLEHRQKSIYHSLYRVMCELLKPQQSYQSMSPMQGHTPPASLFTPKKSPHFLLLVSKINHSSFSVLSSWLLVQLYHLFNSALESQSHP